MNILRFSSPMGYNALSVNAFNELLQDFKSENAYGLPKSNVIDAKENFKIELSVPGFAKEQIEIQFQNNLLSVKGSTEVKTEEQEKYLSKEFELKNFVRRFSVPKTIDSEAITAAFSNGILTIVVPKKEEIVENLAKVIQIS